jgi:4-aminobutyrate aminotransferase-like enzyme/Ser/Thr protein kinase RdoA (MazF antagonist)
VNNLTTEARTPSEVIAELSAEVYAPQLAHDIIEAHVRDRYGLRGTWSALGGEREQNLKLTSQDGQAYVVKVASAHLDPESIEFQNGALLHLESVVAGLRLPTIKRSNAGELTTAIVDEHGVAHPLRVLTFVRGRTVFDRVTSHPGEAPYAMADLLAFGEANGRLARALQGYAHAGAFKKMPWDMANGLLSKQSLIAYLPDDLREQAAPILARFLSETTPRLKRLRSQVIHHDVHESNLLFDADGSGALGIIDFGDMIHGTLAQDVAVPIASFIHWSADPVLAAGAIVRGYQRHVPLAAEDLDVLLDLVMARMILQVALTIYNREAVGRPSPVLDSLLEVYQRSIRRLANVTPQQFVSGMTPGIQGLVSLAPSRSEALPQAAEDLLSRRKHVLGETYMFYDEPLHLVRGQGSSVFDADGKRYLDCYNNVPNVGHCHPHVVSAIAAQAATLNTNTRYLHGEVVRLGERLSRTMPAELDTWVFTCSGSEANDLAVRIARALTGRQGVLVTENSYHGNTAVTADLSLIDYDAAKRPRWIGCLPAPNVYRGRYRSGESDLGRKYADHVDAARSELNAAGEDVAAVLIDSVFDAEGVLVPPADYLPLVWQRIKASGGLYIADEVQMGFGRSGTHMWGFEEFGIVPDIVTLGKPMGNGHPIAAVAMRRDIAREFRKHSGYFNTFGGNPVSAAAANAALDVLFGDQLQERARVVGLELRSRMFEMAHRHACIGHVHGRGLFLGLDIVADRTTREPSKPSARRIRERLKQLGVLAATTGPLGNIVKIRPPMCFTLKDAEECLAALDIALSEACG